MQGDGTIVARIASQDKVMGGAGDGLMIRNTLDPASAVAAINLLPQGELDFLYRSIANNNVITKSVWTLKAPLWVKLQRVGNVFTASYSTDGISWTVVGTPQTLFMNNEVFLGMHGFSYINTNVHNATIDNLSMSGILACMHNTPSLSMTPSTQTTSGVTPVNYQVAITNNDTMGCGASTYTLAASTNNASLQPLLSKSSLSLTPGQTSGVSVSATPLSGLTAGTYTLTVKGGAGITGTASAALVYQVNTGFKVSASTDALIYKRSSTTVNAKLISNTTFNSTPATNVPLTIIIYKPDGTQSQSSTNSGTGTATILFPITATTLTGTYTFKTVATYQNTNYSANTTFVVQ